MGNKINFIRLFIKDSVSFLLRVRLPMECSVKPQKRELKNQSGKKKKVEAADGVGMWAGRSLRRAVHIPTPRIRLKKDRVK